MGTDSINQFNKSLADRILAMDRSSLTTFLSENIDISRRKESSFNPVLLQMEQHGGSVSDAVEMLLGHEYSLPQLKAEVVRDSAFGDEEIKLDYWGCYAHVFNGHPDGSISSVSYLPCEEEETFILLQPSHVTQMINSLYEHRDDLTVMGEEEIKKIERWRDQCLSNSDCMIAYLFDF